MHKALVGVLVILLVAFIVYMVLVMIYALQGCNDEYPQWSTEAALAYLHSTIKGVYGLTLKRNVHKTNHIKNVMTDLGLPFQVWYGHDAKQKGVHGVCPQHTKRSPGELGCTLSHLAIWKDAVSKPSTSNSGHGWFLILEDDADPALSHPQLLSFMAEALKRSDEEGYRVVYFGSAPIKTDALKGKRLDRHRWRLKAGGLQSYAIKSSALQDLIATVENKLCEKPVDIIMASEWKEPGVTVAKQAFQPFRFFRQFQNCSTGIFGQKRDDMHFSSDIIKK